MGRLREEGAQAHLQLPSREAPSLKPRWSAVTKVDRPPVLAFLS